MKIVKKIIVLAIILFGVGYGVNYALEPAKPIDNSRRLCFVDERVDLKKINKEVVKKVSKEKNNIDISMSMNNGIFNKILKNYVIRSGEINLESYIFELKNDHINVIVPYKKGPFNLYVDTNVNLKTTGKELIIELSNMKVGRVNIPDYIIKILTKQLNKATTQRVYAKGNAIHISYGRSGVSIKKIYIKNSVLHITFEVKDYNYSKLGVEIFKTMFDY